jgi:hypothetical protein
VVCQKPKDNQDCLVHSGEPNIQPPFPETCRVRKIRGITEFAQCLSPPPHACGYIFQYGDILICNHPRCREMVTRTPDTAKTGWIDPALDIK